MYYCLSQGLLDPSALEQIQSKRVLNDVNMAPSYILKETWQQANAANSLCRFVAISVSNLIEQGERDARALDNHMRDFLTHNQIDSSVFGAIQGEIQARQGRNDWNLSEQNIQAELDRNDQSGVSFYFALRWLQFEIESLKKQQKKPNGLLSAIQATDSTQKQLPKLTSQQQLQSLCYFKYLESNKFIGIREE